MIQWRNQDDDMWEGIFQSRILRNEANQPEMFICIQNPDDADYAQRCAEHCNALPDSMLDAICMGIVKCAAQGGMEEDFELPELDNVRDILQYCWFTTLMPSIPETAFPTLPKVRANGARSLAL